MATRQDESSPDLLGDLLGPLAIEGPPGVAMQSENEMVPRAEGASAAVDALALAPVEEQTNAVQVPSFVLKNIEYLNFLAKMTNLLVDC